MRELTRFSPEVADRLKFYVYRLIDPRNGETFYVGRGRDDRVFDHVNAKAPAEKPGERLERIREIRLAGLSVVQIIHRHGIENEYTAAEVEAAVISSFPGLTNIQAGEGSGVRGPAHVLELEARYAAEQAVFQHKSLLINITKSALTTSIYEAVRFAWKLNMSRAECAEIVLAVRQGLILEVFVPERWLFATEANFPGRGGFPKRLGFEGIVASDEVRNMYIGKKVPRNLRSPGTANPVRYSW